MSAFGTAFLLRGESSQWVRDELGSRFAVRTVIEFGGVFPNVHPAMRFCIIQLGKTQGSAFLISITGDTRNELDEGVRAANHVFAGEKPATGFTADVKANGRWAVKLIRPRTEQAGGASCRDRPNQTAIRGVYDTARCLHHPARQERKAHRGAILGFRRANAHGTFSRESSRPHARTTGNARPAGDRHGGGRVTTPFG